MQILIRLPTIPSWNVCMAIRDMVMLMSRSMHQHKINWASAMLLAMELNKIIKKH